MLIQDLRIECPQIRAKICTYCGKTFVTYDRRVKLCSAKCRSMAHKEAQDRGNLKKNMQRKAETQNRLKPKACAVCNKTFIPRSERQVCCCTACQNIRTKQQQRDWGKEPAKQEPEKLSLAEIDRIAKAHGMTYGQYILLKQQELENNTTC